MSDLEVKAQIYNDWQGEEIKGWLGWIYWHTQKKRKRQEMRGGGGEKKTE